MSRYPRTRDLGQRVRVICWVCGTVVEAVLDGDGGFGDDGTLFKWFLVDRSGCDCLDDDEVLEVWQEAKTEP